MEVLKNFRVDIDFKKIILNTKVFFLKFKHIIAGGGKSEVLSNDEKMTYKLLWAGFEEGKIHSDSTGLLKIKGILLFSFLTIAFYVLVQ